MVHFTGVLGLYLAHMLSGPPSTQHIAGLHARTRLAPLSPLQQSRVAILCPYTTWQAVTGAAIVGNQDSRIHT